MVAVEKIGQIVEEIYRRGYLEELNTLVVYSIISESEVKPEEVPKVKPEAEKIEEIFRTCYIPVANTPGFIGDMEDYCNNPSLKKVDFLVKSTSSVEFKGKEMVLVEIEPVTYPDRKAICLAFQEIAREIRKRGGYAVANCGYYITLKVAVPKSSKKGRVVNLVKLLS